jgi:iron(III) transport system ATP-binding protein
MDRAVIAQQGTPRELYELPRDAFVPGFIGESNPVRGLRGHRSTTQGEVRLGPLTVGLPAQGGVQNTGPSSSHPRPIMSPISLRLVR